MPVHGARFSKKAPFVRLIIPLIAGILLQSQFRPGLLFLNWILITSVAGLFLYSFIPFFSRFRFFWLSGILAGSILASTGALLTWRNDITNDKNWFGHYYQDKDGVLLTLEEPLIEKSGSWKAEASVHYLLRERTRIQVKGKLILYFKKEPGIRRLDYGSVIIFRKSLREIRNAGNPGGFDFKTYSFFHGVTHQVYLNSDEFELLPGKKEKRFTRFLYDTRENILRILRANIKDEKVLGLAEALLIGYKNDLDKTLVQSYTYHCDIRTASRIDIRVTCSTDQGVPSQKKREMVTGCPYHHRFVVI
jgi:competence protein ComEC